MNRKMIWNDGLDSWTEEELLCMKYLNVCYGKGGGSAPPPPPSSVQQSTTAEFPTELRPFVSDIFEKSQAIQEQRQEEGYQPELTQQLASFTPEQEASFQGIQNVVGQTQPLFDEATTLARQSGRAATDPAEVAALMNPFLRNVTDIQKREAQRVGDVQEQQLAAQASQAGAFGGSRAAILEAERQRNLNQQLGDIEAQGLAASFQNAQNQLQNQFGRESAAAAQLGALGAAIPAQQFKEFGALSGIGAAKQQQAQRAFDIATQQAREEYGFPMATLQDFSSILRGFPLPATQNVSRQSFSPAQPLSTQLLGLGTGLAGLAGAAGAFKKAGGLVGAPVGMKNGGYVKLAGGGGLGQMMQGKVKKYAEGGSTQIELLSQYSLRELEQLLNNPARVAELGFSPTLIKAELDKKVAGRGSVQDAARASAQGQFIEGMKQVPGQIVDAAQALPAQLASVGEAGARAGQAVSSFIPRSGALADQTADVLKSFMTRDGKKLGDTVGIMDPTGMVGETRAPASLLSASPVGGSTDSATVPVNMDPTAPDPAPDKMTPGLIQRIRSQFPYAGSVSPTLGTIAKDAPPPPVDSINPLTATGSSPVSAPLGSQARRSPPAGTNIADMYSAMPRKLLSIRDSKTGEIREIEEPAITKAVKTLFSTEQSPGGGQMSRQARTAATVQDNLGNLEMPTDLMRTNVMNSTTNSGEIPDIGRVTAPSSTAPTKPAPTAAAPTKAAPTTANSLAEDGQSPPKTAAQLAAESMETVSAVNQAKKDLGEYYEDAEKILGKPPEFEKGEESDFSSRRWLALAQFGTNMLRAGGDKTVFQAMGEAAQPALKELISIGKEEKKLKADLRKEKNAQKRANYSDRIAKLGIAQKLQSADLDHTKTMADIEQKRRRGLLDERTLAETIRRNDVMMDKARVETYTAQFALDSARDGTTTVAQAQAQINKAQEAMAKQLAKTQSLFPNQPVNVADNNRRIREAGARAAAIYAETTFRDEVIDGVKQRVNVDLTQFLAPVQAVPQGELKPTVDGGSYRRK